MVVRGGVMVMGGVGGWNCGVGGRTNKVGGGGERGY